MSDSRDPEFPKDIINGPSIDILQAKVIRKLYENFNPNPNDLSNRKKGKKSKSKGRDSAEGSVCSQTGQQEFTVEDITMAYGPDVACLFDTFNKLLVTSPLAAGYRPLKEENFVEKLGDGVLLCALANLLSPGIVDPSDVVRGPALKSEDGQSHCMNNLGLGLSSLHMLGVCIRNIDTMKISSTQPLCLINLMLQVLRLATVCKFNLRENEQLLYMFDNWSDPDELLNIKNMSRKEIMWQWVNYQLKKSGTDLQFTEISDLSDSLIYAHLIQVVAPEDKKPRLKSIEDLKSNKDLVSRASEMLNNASIIGSYDLRPESMRPNQIVAAGKCTKPNGSAADQRIYLLNLALIFRIYRRYPNIDEPAKKMETALSDDLKGNREKGATEDTLRMWLNSFGPEPTVAYVATDLCNGAVLLQVFESISPKCVNWTKVDLSDTKMPKRKSVWLANCNQVLECAKKHGFKVECSANDLATGHRLNTMDLVLEMMNFHLQQNWKRFSASKLGYLDDSGLVLWFNKQMKQRGAKFKISKLSDDTLRNTNALGFLSERILTEQGLINSTDSGETKMMFSNVAQLKGAEWKTYSSSTIPMLRKVGISIYCTMLNSQVDVDVYRGVLLQLNAMCS